MQLEKYHEQAQLLDPLLASLVIPLSAVLRREANAASAPDLAAVQTASCFLWALITVRCPQENIILVTWKFVAKFECWAVLPSSPSEAQKGL